MDFLKKIHFSKKVLFCYEIFSTPWQNETILRFQRKCALLLHAYRGTETAADATPEKECRKHHHIYRDAATAAPL